MRANHLTISVAPLILQPHLSHRDDGSLLYGARDSQFPMNDKLNDTFSINAVVVLIVQSRIVRQKWQEASVSASDTEFPRNDKLNDRRIEVRLYC